MQPDLDLARRFLDAHPPPGRLLLCAITGSHLYGFPSPDSDLDMKGIHAAPPEAFLGLDTPSDNHDRLEVFEGTECDLTTHEARRALGLLLRGNGNLLERITSPFQVVDGPSVEILRALVPSALSRRCFNHYAGFAKGMRREHEKERTAKTLLYAYRVLLTGRHLLQTGEVESHLPTLADAYGVDSVADVIAFKAEAEYAKLPDDETPRHLPILDALTRAIEDARSSSPLPEDPPDRGAIGRWLVELRMAMIQAP